MARRQNIGLPDWKISKINRTPLKVVQKSQTEYPNRERAISHQMRAVGQFDRSHVFKNPGIFHRGILLSVCTVCTASRQNRFSQLLVNKFDIDIQISP